MINLCKKHPAFFPTFPLTNALFPVIIASIDIDEDKYPSIRPAESLWVVEKGGRHGEIPLGV